MSEPTHEWVGPGRHRRHGHGGEDELHPGDAFTPTDEELAAFGGKIQPLDDGDGEPDADPLEGVKHLSKKTVGELEDALESGDYDDRLDDVQEVEENRNGGPRKTALEAIDERREG